MEQEIKQPVKKPLSLGKIIKRALLIILATIIIIVLLVYFLGKYKASEVTFNNKYSDEYWEKLEGFTRPTDILTNVNKYDMTSKEYKYPWTLAGVSKDTLTPNDIIEYARYKEELNKFVSEEKYRKDNEALIQEKAAMDDSRWDNTKTVDEWISEYLYVDKEDYESITPTYSTALEYVNNTGASLTEEEFVNIIKYSSNKMTDLEKAGYDGEYNDLAAHIYNDNALYTKICTFDDAKYSELETKIEASNHILDLVDAKLAALSSWSSYRETTLLGPGGIGLSTGTEPTLTKTLENGNKYEFYFSNYTTAFKLVLKDSSDNILQTWDSCVPEEDPNATLVTRILQNSILTVSYAVLKGQTGTYTNYEYSVTDHDLRSNESLTPNYMYKIDSANDTLTCWYHIEKRGIDYTYFPKCINKDKLLDDYMERSKERKEAGVTVQTGTTKGRVVDYVKDNRSAYARLTEGYYRLIAEDDPGNEFGYSYYEFQGSLDSMSTTVKNNLYLYLYEWCGYTREDLESDNEEFNQEVDISNPKFEIAIEYHLGEDGLEVTIPGNSIKDDPNYPITFIEILPYFTATKKGIEGYTIIPDGSGAILNHDNGKTAYAKYSKRVYSTDLSYVQYVNPGSTQELFFPMYAVVNPGNNSGMIANAKESAAQLLLTCDISGRNDSYNKNFFTCYVRESKGITVGTASYERKHLTKWTNAMSKNDIVIDYDFIPQDKLNYSDVAKIYQNKLKKIYNLEEKDHTTNPVLNLEVIGTYSHKANFVGIPYNAKDSLTTLEQLEEMIAKVKQLGPQNINISYLGWRKENLKDVSFTSMKISSLIGSKSKFQAMLNNNDSSVNLYPYVNFGEYNIFKESFGSMHYTSHAVDGKRSEWRPYDINTNVYDKTKGWVYALSPRYFVSFAEKLAKNYSRLTDNANNLAVMDLGSRLTGDYKKGIETFKINAVNEQIKSFEILNKAGINNLTLYAPYDYALKYTTVAKEIPFQYTAYEVFDYSIPFYQLVVNGLFDYSGTSINANIEKGLTEQLMRIIETGSNIAFTVTADSSEKLLQTDYNYYYFTLFDDWTDDIKYVYKVLNDLEIFKYRFVSHEQLSSNIFKVVYSDGTNSKTIYLNYTRNPYTATDGTVVEAKNYAVAI